MKMLTRCFAFIAIGILAGCAGSGMHTKTLSSNQLMSLDNYTLCKAYTPKELYSPNAKIINEVQRRGLNCSSVYQYSGGNLDRAVRSLQSISPQQNAPQNRPVAHKTGEASKGFNKVCFYDRLGSAEAYNFKNTDICPLTMQ